MNSIWEKIGAIATIVAIIIALVTQTLKLGNAESLILMGIIFVIVIIYFITTFIGNKFKQIDKLYDKTISLEEKVNYMKEIHELDKRVSLLEKKKGKKGNLDPRIIIIIILVFLLYLYLKAIGFLK